MPQATLSAHRQIPYSCPCAPHIRHRFPYHRVVSRAPYRSGLTAALVYFLVCCACAQNSSQPEQRVLFIGNSLTYTNDLPRMVSVLAGATPHCRLHTEAVALPNFSLEDHWQQGEAAHRLQQGHWKWVVLQQGPSALPESRELLVNFARRWNAAIRTAGATPALLAVWPSASRSADFDRVVESYRLAAQEVDGVFLPAGAAWQYILAKKATRLYGPDGFHPSAEGSFLAAVVIVGKLCSCSPAELSAAVHRSATRWNVPAEDESKLLAAAFLALSPDRAKATTGRPMASH